MGRKVMIYLLPPIALVAVFLIFDLLTGQHNLWISVGVTLGWWLFSFGSEFLSKSWQRILFFICVAILVFIVGFCIYIKFTS